jgi:tetratricopeptide (TPR) repeat protein
MNEFESALELLEKRVHLFDYKATMGIWNYNRGVLQFSIRRYADALSSFQQSDQDDSQILDPEHTSIDVQCACMLHVANTSQADSKTQFMQRIDDILVFLHHDFEKSCCHDEMSSTHLHPYLLTTLRLAQVRIENGEYPTAITTFSQTVLSINSSSIIPLHLCWEHWKSIFLRYMKDIALKKCQQMSQKTRGAIWSFLEAVSSKYQTDDTIQFQSSQVKAFLIESVS